MSSVTITQVEDVLDLVETDMTDDALERLIERQEAWLASRVGDLAEFDAGIVVDAVIELCWIVITSHGVVTSERDGTHSTQVFQQPNAAEQLRTLIVRRLRPPGPVTIRLRSTLSDRPR